MRWCSSVAVLLAAGCTFTPPSGHFLCGDDDVCPPGQVCGAEGRCVNPADHVDPMGPDAASDAGRATDAAADAFVVPVDGGRDAASDADAALDAGCDLACGEGTCVGTGSEARCLCPPPRSGEACADCEDGYSGAECTFVPLIDDPEMDSPAAWSASGAARIESGLGLLDSAAFCTGGTLTQTVTFPTRIALPLVFRVRFRGTGYPRMAARVGTHAFDLGHAPDSGFRDEGVCLDASLAGQTVEIGVEPGSHDCGPSAVEVLSVELRPADEAECPGGGDVPGGDFESGVGSWVAYGAGGTGVALSGIHGGRGARLVPEEFGQATLHGTVAIPTHSDVPRPALRLWHSGENAQVGVLLDDQPLGVVPAGEDGMRVFCLPPWVAGRSLGVAVTASRTVPALSANLELDDLEVVDEPGCDFSRGLVGGGFEVMATAEMVRPFSRTVMDAPFPVSAEPAVLVSPPDAYRGMRALELRVDTCDTTSTGMEFQGRAPEASGGQGPALLLATRGVAVAAGDVPQVDIQELEGGALLTLEVHQAWEEQVLCLPPMTPSRARTFHVHVNSRHWECPSTRDASVLFDEVRLGTSPDCPVF
ncbi:MAG: hypothetical protein AB8I08_09600 [Sandaracinaceae bacterium]